MDDDFILVQSKKGRNRRRGEQNVSKGICVGDELIRINQSKDLRRAVQEADYPPRDQVVKSLLSHKEDLKSIGYLQEVLDALSKLVDNLEGQNDGQPPKINKIVCFGLGSILFSRTSSCQLGLLMGLQEELQCTTVELYDPVFTSIDKEVLTGETCRFQLIDHNQEGKYVLDSDDHNFTLFFLPHCAHALLNNVLFANWDRTRLCNCIILGNDFEDVVNSPNSVVKDSPRFSFIQRAYGISNIRPLLVPPNYYNVFNSFVICGFSRSQIEKFSRDNVFWEKNEQFYESTSSSLVNLS